MACDVSDPQGVEEVEAAALAFFGGGQSVHLWINNAAYSGSFRHLLDQQDTQVEQVRRRTRDGGGEGGDGERASQCGGGAAW